MYLQRRAKSPLISILIVSTFKVSPRTVTSTQNFLWTRNVSLGTGSKEKAPGGLGGIKSSRMRKPEVSTTIPDETILSKAGWLMRAPSLISLMSLCPCCCSPHRAPAAAARAAGVSTHQSHYVTRSSGHQALRRALPYPGAFASMANMELRLHTRAPSMTPRISCR